MTGRDFHPAATDEIDRLVRPLVATRVFGSIDEVIAAHASEPWRIQVSARGDVAILGRWRDHLPLLAIEAMWCQPAAIPRAIRQIRAAAREHGFTGLVSPPVSVEALRPYESAGMQVHTVVTTLTRPRLQQPTAVTPRPEWLALRQAGPADLPGLLDIDGRSFDAFWRYDATHLTRFCDTSRLVIAERDGETVGYTLCTVDRGEGMLGRLCVSPVWRRQGVGFALLLDAMNHVVEQGGNRLTLSTQMDNTASQALYRKALFRDTGRRYAFLCLDIGER